MVRVTVLVSVPSVAAGHGNPQIDRVAAGVLGTRLLHRFVEDHDDALGIATGGDAFEHRWRGVALGGHHLGAALGSFGAVVVDRRDPVAVAGRLLEAAVGVGQALDHRHQHFVTKHLVLDDSGLGVGGRRPGELDLFVAQSGAGDDTSGAEGGVRSGDPTGASLTP